MKLRCNYSVIVRFDAVGACRHGYHYTTPASFGSALSSTSHRHRHIPKFPPNLPTRIECIMSSDGRSRRRELVEEAYNLQVKAGLMASRIAFPFGYFDPSLSLSLLLPLSVLVADTSFYTLSQLTHMT